MSNYAQRAYDIYSAALEIEFEFDDLASVRLAKKEISMAQANIRAVKAEVVNEQREVRERFQEESRKLTAGGQNASLAAGALFGRKGRRVASLGRTSARSSLTKRKNEAMADFDRTKAYIDQLLAVLSRTKLEIDRALASRS